MSLAVKPIFVAETREHAENQHGHDYPDHGFFVTPKPNNAKQARS